MTISRVLKKAIILALGAVVLASAPHAETPKNFTLTVDGKAYDINEGNTLTVKNRSGQNVVIALKRKEFSTFEKDYLSFEHQGDLSVAATDIEPDIHQYLVASALGTLVLVQKYDKINPTGLSDFMLKSLVNIDVAAGAKVEKSDFSQGLRDGTKMSGLKATLKSDKSEVAFEIQSLDVGPGGIIAVSRIDTDASNADQALVHHFWDSLDVKK